ncbi:MAG TPA: methyl-accepting chemotaxis protein [Terracidiphilus sp.]|nr:methyl-accepting chemotaxis protein [Terracidiphilus sp.]
MSAIRNLPVNRKLSYSFGSVIVICAAMGALLIAGMVRINSSVSHIVHHAMPSMRVLADIRFQMATIRRTEALLLLCTDSACENHYIAKRAATVDAFQASMTAYEALASYPGERDLFNVIRENSTAYINISNQAGEAFRAGSKQQAAAMLLVPEAHRSYDATSDAIEKDIALNHKFGDETGTAAIQQGHNVVISACIMTPVAMLLCLMVAFFLSRLIVPPLLAATRALERFAEKDLTVSIDEQGEDEIGRVASAVNTTVAVMRSMVHSISHGAETLSSAATQLSARSTQTGSNTRSQAGRTGQIAAAAQEMTATIGEISRNSELAAVAGRSSAETAIDGGRIMESTAATMQRISDVTFTVGEKMRSLADRSNEIGKIVNVIQEISEQTNLLALNAAIEAARAGEQGRGFAVVAGEVRRLAERTKGATEEITSTIRGIQEETRVTLDVVAGSRSAVEEGISETANARSSLEKIIQASREVERQIAMIATAATEQTAASNEISDSAHSISELAAENASASDEAVVGAKHLSDLANELDGIIRQFRVDNGEKKTGRLKTGPRSVPETSRRAA